MGLLQGQNLFIPNGCNSVTLFSMRSINSRNVRSRPKTARYGKKSCTSLQIADEFDTGHRVKRIHIYEELLLKLIVRVQTVERNRHVLREFHERRWRAALSTASHQSGFVRIPDGRAALEHW